MHDYIKLLIIEPDTTGHHMSLYVRLVVHAAVTNGISISLLTKKNVTNHQAFQLVMDEAQEKLKIHYMPNLPRLSSSATYALLVNQLISFFEISQGYRKIKKNSRFEKILLINFDCIEKVFSFFGSPFEDVPFSCLLMSITHHRYKLKIGPKRRLDWLYLRLFRRLLKMKELRGLAVIDEAFYNTLAISDNPYEKKIKLVNDPVLTINVINKRTARKTLGVPMNKFVILVYGGITKRKSLRELILAVTSISDDRFAILIAGEITHEIQSLGQSNEYKKLAANGQIFLSRGFHDDARQNLVFGASDVVWVAYSRGFYGSSGVLYLAGAARLPVIGSSHGLIGWILRKYTTGLCCDPHNTAEVIDVLIMLFKDEQLRSTLGNCGFSLAGKHAGTDFALDLLKL